MPQQSNYLLIGAVLFFTISYYYQVPQNPPGFYIDEASIAYNAYTISQTGRDEYGESWPLYFRAFGEYKNPVYIYLLSVLFRVFGPSILVARLFSASLTVIAIGILWLLSYRLSHRKRVASLVALSALLTPWLFENSRLVFEVALYPPLLALFLHVVFLASKKEQWGVGQAIPLAALLSLLSYSASVGRLFALLLAIGLLFFVSRRRVVALATTWVLYAASLVPGILYNQRHGGALMSRFWLLTYLGPEKSIGETVGMFIRHYLANINPWTIAITGENNVRDHVGTMGSILAPSLLLALAGVVYVIRHYRKESWWRFMLYALVVAPIPASLTTTAFPQIRLIALPVLLHVFLVPAIFWLTETRDRGSSRQLTLVALMLIMLTQGVIYRVQFRKAGPERWYIFDEQFPREVLPTALAQNKWPIYFHDPPTKSGYAELYWYGALRGLPADKFVRLSGDEKAPKDAVVISTAEECTNCQLLLKSINYIVYISGNGVSTIAR
jgi:hypothetical protein